MKIGELSRKTGVPASTIRYYIKEGLLPRPKLKKRNIAYYDESYIPRIMAIKELQNKRFLPLKIVKRFLKSVSKDLSLIPSYGELNFIMNVKGKLFKGLSFPIKIPPLTPKEVIQRTGITPSDLEELEKLGFIEQKDGYYLEEDIQVAEIGATLRKTGFTREAGFEVRDLLFVKEAAAKLAQEEIKIFLKKVGQRLLRGDLEKFVKEGVEGINSLIGVLNRKFLKKALEETEKKTLKDK